MTAPTPLPSIPVLETERLVMRAPELGDLDAFAAFGASERSHIVGGPFDRIDTFQSLCAQIGHWSLRGYGRWFLDAKGGPRRIGLVGLIFPEAWPEPEIAWTVFEDAEGKGYAHEAALAARDYAYRTLGWTTAVSLVDPANTRSVALARRMGCREDGVHPHPRFGDLHIWRHPAPEARP